MVARAGNRAGKVKLGCLLALAVLAALLIVGFDAGSIYFRYYRLQDFVKGQAELAPALTDQVILQRLVAYSDTLGVGLGVRDWKIRRVYTPQRQITIGAQYRDSVVIALPGIRKVFYAEFKPSATAPF